MNNNPDPYNLSRFVDAQANYYEKALQEIQNGRKEGHWIWFIFPQVKGLGHSQMSQNYGITSLDEARTYLAHSVLRAHLLEISEALLFHKEDTASNILGTIDAMKVRSCMTLFDLVEPDAIFDKVLNTFYHGERDKKTLQLLHVSAHERTFDALFQPPQQWDARQWLRELDIAKQRHETHAVRQQVFRSTVRIVEKAQYISQTNKRVELQTYLNLNAIEDNQFYSNEIESQPIENKFDTIYKVVNQDCLDFAHALLMADETDDVCVLNLASASNPGGGVISGAGAQEEYLFRCSDYYRFLYQYASSFDCTQYGINPHPQYRYPLNRDFGGIYSHGVTIFRDTEARGYALIDQPWNANFIAVAACNLRFADRGEFIPNYLVPTTLNKIRTILRIAYTNHQSRLVLGALGCGAFGNPPRHMALLFKQCFEEPEFSGRFKEVYFAILSDHNDRYGNFQAFNEVFG